MRLIAMAAAVAFVASACVSTDQTATLCVVYEDIPHASIRDCEF